jgi:hypothetical protein
MDHTEPEFRSTVNAFCSTINAIFIATFPILGSVIADHVGYEGAFVLTAVGLVPLLLAITRLDLGRPAAAPVIQASATGR